MSQIKNYYRNRRLSIQVQRFTELDFMSVSGALTDHTVYPHKTLWRCVPKGLDACSNRLIWEG